MGHNRNLADYAHHFDGTNIDLGSGNIETEGVVTYEDVTNVDAIGIVTARAGVKVPDSQKIFLGTGDDLQIFHNGSNSYIDNVTGHFYIRNYSDDNDIYIQTDNGSGGLVNYLFCDGSSGRVVLSHYGSGKIETSSTGATVTGTLVSDSVTSELDLSAISSSVSDTATDIFVYDTRKDSDGGAWRKRTQHTSWYNETLNTSIRGSRKEFPAVAVIVCLSGYIKIYDGDDPDLPLWMEIRGTTDRRDRGWLYSANVTAASALNGIIALATYGNGTDSGGTHIVDFVKDDLRRHSSAGGRSGDGLIITQRGTSVNLNTSTSLGLVVSELQNDVAMTVLPNAPIDDATGLPVPTIAVATQGGVSIIKDDGTVVDLNVVNRPYSSVYFSDDHLVWAVENPGGVNYDLLRYFEIPAVDITNSTSYGPSSTPALFPTNTKGNIFNSYAYGSPVGLTIIDHTDGTGTVANSRVAYATTSYNTGWLHGDIKGAFLSDTDTTNLVYTDILGGKGTFDDASYWTAGATWTISGGVATSSTGGNNYLSKNGILTTGARYVITLTVSSYSAGTLYVYCGTGAPGTANHYSSISSNGTYTFILDAYNTNFGLYGAGFGGVVDNLTISSVVDNDRSINGKDLGVLGTITKTAVATGAELVAYGGFSHSNYLRQPHNADLNVGTGDFYIMCWAKGNRYFLWHRNDSGSLDMRCEFPTSGGSANKPRFYMRNGSATIDFYATTAFDTTTWHHCVWVKRGARNGELYIDGVLNNSGNASSDVNLNGTNSTFSIGNRADNPTEDFNGYVSLFKFGASAPSVEQIKKIYEDEKVLFQENAKATLYGSSDAVTALGYDEDTELLHVGTSSGRSDFQGLCRINNTTTAVTTAISASDELIAEQ